LVVIVLLLMVLFPFERVCVDASAGLANGMAAAAAARPSPAVMIPRRVAWLFDWLISISSDHYRDIYYRGTNKLSLF
jgi:hypothetical protein